MRMSEKPRDIYTGKTRNGRKATTKMWSEIKEQEGKENSKQA